MHRVARSVLGVIGASGLAMRTAMRLSTNCICILLDADAVRRAPVLQPVETACSETLQAASIPPSALPLQRPSLPPSQCAGLRCDFVHTHVATAPLVDCIPSAGQHTT